MSKLGKKLFIVFLALVVFSLFLAGLFINFSIGESFDNFINLQREQKIEHLSSMIIDNYEANNFNNLESIIENFSRTNKIPIWLEDQRGEILYFSAQKGQMSMMMRRMRMYHNNHMQMQMQHLPDDFPGITREEIIKLNGNNIKLYWKEINSDSQLESNIYDYFKENIFKAVISSALIAIIITMILSFILSRKITDPLIKMKNAVLEVAEGKYQQKINSSGDDELTELVTAFNKMSKKLFKLEKIRKESASDLAHELRTPLTTIKAYLEAIEDGKLKADQESIKEMQEETARMTNLIEKLNEFGDAQNKIFALKKEEINLSEIITKVIRQQQSFIKSKKINIKVEIENQLCIRGDKDSLIQIFNNVLENAVKYNKMNGEIKIKSKKDNNKVEVLIKDTGFGISKKDLPYIFERFYRADKSRNSKNTGSGIGLAVVKELMDAHNAVIEVESNKKGTSFKLIFRE